MSFWPRLRRRSRGRKRSPSAAKTNKNLYASSDTYKVVHEELQAQRAQFASEKGVSVELVRFVSRSSRGWVYLPSETPSSATTPRPSHDGEVSFSISTTPDASEEFSPTPPILHLPPSAPSTEKGEKADGSSGDGAESSSTVGNGVMGLDLKGDSRNVGRLVVSRKLKDEAWLRISKTAAVLYVKVSVFSRALGASTAFAFTFAVAVDIWNRGKGIFRRVFSALAAQLLNTLRPYLTLPQSKSSPALLRGPPKSVPQASASEQASASIEMKVSPILEDSVKDLRSASFAFPVLSKDLVPTSPRFTAQHQKSVPSSQIASTGEEISPAPAPLVESNKQPTTKHCKLKSKLFKSSQDRKGENSSPSAEFCQLNDATSSSGSSFSSPGRGKSSKKKTTASCISRKSSIFSDDDYDEVVKPSPVLKSPKKITRSHELLFFRSPNRRKETISGKGSPTMSAVPSGGVHNLSRSLESSIKSLGRKKVSRSEEFTNFALPCAMENLALPKSTVEGLETLAFPFKVQRPILQKERRPSLPCSPRDSTPTKRRNSLAKLMAVEPTPTFEKYSSRGMESRSSSPNGSVKGGKSTSSVSSSSALVSSSKASAMLAAAELKPRLRKVRTAVGLPAGSEQHGSDLRRVKPMSSSSLSQPSQSQVVSREILGSILLLAVLGFLMLGRIPAILCTACLCLVISCIQRFFLRHLTRRDVELLQRSSGISRLHHSITATPELVSGYPKLPAPGKHGLQSSDYRKRVLIEGLLDRGNRRGGHL